MIEINKAEFAVFAKGWMATSEAEKLAVSRIFLGRLRTDPVYGPQYRKIVRLISNGALQDLIAEEGVRFVDGGPLIRQGE